jgi:hypothetical protein
VIALLIGAVCAGLLCLWSLCRMAARVPEEWRAQARPFTTMDGEARCECGRRMESGELLCARCLVKT